MEEFFRFGETIFSDGLFAFIIQAVVAITIARILSGIVRRTLNKTMDLQTPAQRTPIRFLENTLKTVIYVIAAFIILSNVKPMAAFGKAMLGATSLLAVVGGLAAQEAFGNFIDGFFLSLTQPFRIGDVVDLSAFGETIEGTVTDLTFRHTEITTYDNTRMIVPNATMNNATLIVRTRSDGQCISKAITLGIAYDADLEKAKGIINEICLAQPGFVDLRSDEQKRSGVSAVEVKLIDFADSSVTIHFRVHAKNPADLWNVQCGVKEEILRRFNAEGIVIPYPIRTVQIQK